MMSHDADLQLQDPKFFASGDTHAIWNRLRREDPVHWTEGRFGRGFWSVTRHADVQSVLRNNVAFSSNRFGPSLPTRPELIDVKQSEHARLQQSGAILNSMDPPKHPKMRQQMMSRFTPKVVASMADKVRTVASGILDDIPVHGQVDFAKDIAARLPITIIFRMMEIPESDWPMLFRYANMHTAPEEPEYSIGTPIETRERAVRGMVDYCRELALERRRHPGDDLLSMLATLEVDGVQLNADELGANGLMFVIAGQETTRNSLSAGVRELIRNPAELDRMRADPQLFKSAPDEFIRWGNPVAHLLRTATTDIELGGKLIKDGDWVVSWIASANRDDAVFTDPFRFDVGRTPNPHVGFGFGPHFCIGAFLARLEIQILMELLLQRVGSITLAGEPEQVSSIQFCGYKSLPVHLGPRA